MKHSFKIISYFLICLTLLNCKNHSQNTSSNVKFVTERAPIEFQFPLGWYKNPDKHPFDLQCFSKSQRMNTGVFVFNKINIASDSTPLDIFWTQVDDLKSKRRNFKIFEKLKHTQNNEKSFTTITYMGDKGYSRYYYKFTLIEFETDKDIFAVVIQISFPNDWNKNDPIYENINQSAKLKKHIK